MRGTIKIGSKMVELLANGATPIRYKQLFKKDLLRILIQNSEMDDKRRKLLDDAAAEFREQHTPEEAKRMIEERKQRIDEEIRQQEEITGQHIELSDVKRYANAVDSLAQDLIPQEQLDAFEEKVYASYETTTQLAYIMASQAAAKVPSDMAKISMDSYYEWLATFEPHEIEAASDEIMSIYNGTAKTDPEVTPKKDDADSTETTTLQFTRSE